MNKSEFLHILRSSLGLVLICAGLCLLTGLLAVALGRAAVRGGKWLWRQFKKLFIKREG